MSGITFIDLFCGIGTIRMGMEQAGHKCVYSVEWDKHKRKIYSIIFGGEPEGADICSINARDMPTADVWAFGAPCQDFSIAGKGAGLEGDRSSLVREVFRLVRETKEEHRPKYLLYENVKGMLSSNKGFDYLEILSEMESLGYDFEWQLLNSKNFGVPQNRERVFTLGHLRGRSTEKVFPIEGTDGADLKQIIGGSQGQRVYDTGGVSCTLSSHGGGQGAKTGLYHIPATIGKEKGMDSCFITDLGKVTANCICGRDYKGLRRSFNVVAVLTPDRVEKRQNGRRMKDPGEPMFTLTKQDRHGIYDGEGIRKLTPRETWRLQGVSDEIIDKVIKAGISDTQMYIGSGDACTKNVIYEIAKKLT